MCIPVIFHGELIRENINYEDGKKQDVIAPTFFRFKESTGYSLKQVLCFSSLLHTTQV
jgi:hypothetical protein